MLNLSLSGCGFLGVYHIGVISAFKEHAPEIIQYKISGCSAGSLVAACALCDCCLGQMVSDALEIALKARSYALGPLHPSFNIVEILRNGLRRILPVDAHKICSGRLNVSLTRWKDGKNWLVNTFDTREELIQALLCSSFVPFYSGIFPPKFKGVYCWDGGLSNNNPILDQNTIVVAPFGGESDICPREESASYYCFDLQGTNIQWSKENFYRLSKALFPPSAQVLKAICFRGYKDGINFLKSRNLLPCSCHHSYLREKTTLRSLMGDDFQSVYSEDEISDENDESDELSKAIIDSADDEDQIEQYAQSAAQPLKFQEMPKPVCDILDAACADHKESLISYMYNSQACRAISIMFLPWTLPFDMSIQFTKRLIELIPKPTTNDSSKGFIDSVLVLLHFLIQKLTYDKYQYHARVTCKLCLIKSHQIDSKVGGLKFSLCYHGNNNQTPTTTSADLAITDINCQQQQQHADSICKYASDIDCSRTTTSDTHLNISLVQALPEQHQEQVQEHQHNHHHHHHYQVQEPKLCAKHRLPSICYSSSEHANSIITTSTGGARSLQQGKYYQMLQKRQYKYLKDEEKTSIDTTNVDNLDEKKIKLKSNSLSSSLSSSYKTHKYFNRRKLRRFNLYKNNLNANSVPVSIQLQQPMSSGMLTTIPSAANEVVASSNIIKSSSGLTVPIDIPSKSSNVHFNLSFESDNDVRNSSDDDNDDDDDGDKEDDDDINDDDDVVSVGLNDLNTNNFKIMKKYEAEKCKSDKISKKIVSSGSFSSITVKQSSNSSASSINETRTQLVSRTTLTTIQPSITTINEINEINLDYSFINDAQEVDDYNEDMGINNNKNDQMVIVEDDKQQLLSNQLNDNSSVNLSNHPDIDTYLDKLELNLFGNINS